MDTSIQEFCKIGIVHFMMWKDTIKGEGDHSSIDTILNDSHFDAIEMTWIKDDATRAEVAKKLKASGKQVAFGAQPVELVQGLNINDLDEEKRQASVQSVKDHVAQAYEIGAKGFGVLSGKTFGEEKRQEALAQLLKSLKEIATEVKKQGDIPLVLEIFDQLDYGKNALVGNNEDAAYIATEMRKEFPNFGLMIDLSHLPLCGVTAKETWDAVGEFVVHAHMGNAIMDQPEHAMNGDEHPPFCDPAGVNGVEELREYLQVLKDGGYLNKETRPVLSYEVCIYGDLTQEQAIKQSKEVLAEAWALVK